MKSLKILQIAAASAALLLAACGSDDDGANNTNNNTNSGGAVTCEGNLCQVQGEILENTTFTADNEYVLNGGVFVGNDTDPVVLEIEPGTTIFGSSGTLSFLTVRRNAQLVAEGRVDAPIVFTSAKEEGTRARGDWGGLIINGNAPLNTCSDEVCESEGEGSTGVYGGDDPNDSSGSLKYVRVEFAGALITSENELNGIAFQGVGSGTTIENVQVHMNADDGIEFFGGNANARNIVLTGIGDDSLDWTDGWQGKIQFLVAQQYADDGDQGIEADNNGDNNSATPRSNPTLSNLTFIGVPGGEGSDVGMLLREGTAASISNIILTGFNDGCVQLDQEATFENAWNGTDALSGELTVQNAIIDCENAFVEPEDFTGPFTVEEFFVDLNGGNQQADPMLTNPRPESGAPNYLPQAGSPALGAGEVPNDDFFEKVDYIGAFGSDDWTAGWTTNARN